MNKKKVLADLAAVANMLDTQGSYKEANVVTEVMKRVANRPWWQNEAGEPMYSPEAIRAEENYTPEYDPDAYLSDRDRDFDDGLGEMLQDRFEGVYENWASHQKDLPVVEQKMHDDKWSAHQQSSAPEIEKRQKQYPDTFNPDQYLKNTWFAPEFKGDVAELIFSPQSVHKDTRFEDPDTLHNILDAAKAAVMNGTDILAAINSVPAEGQYGGYEGPEDFGWDGGRED